MLCALYLVFWTRPTRLVDAIVWTNLASAVFFACTFAGGVVESGLAMLGHVVSSRSQLRSRCARCCSSRTAVRRRARSPATAPGRSRASPCSTSLRPGIDRVFFADRWAFEQGSRVVADDAGTLDPFGRAVLETLDVPLVLPIWGHGRLAGLLALGHKRSGDVFTSTERALLATVADKLASELERFDQAERLAASDRLQAALHQYVAPGIAERLGRGEAVELGEREVSVLFSDLREYTAWAQSRPLAELHATVNRYAEAVARRACAGSPGDAPRPRARRARARRGSRRASPCRRRSPR